MSKIVLIFIVVCLSLIGAYATKYIVLQGLADYQKSSACIAVYIRAGIPRAAITVDGATCHLITEK